MAELDAELDNCAEFFFPVVCTGMLDTHDTTDISTSTLKNVFMMFAEAQKQGKERRSVRKSLHVDRRLRRLGRRYSPKL